MKGEDDMSNILVIGGTGNMGRPLVKSLFECGHKVFVVCRKKVNDDDVQVMENRGGGYFYGDAKDKNFMGGVLNRHYDAIVDFCIYSSVEFGDRIDAFLDKTDQYVCLSTAAVYADVPMPKNESSPRYMEVDPPKEGTAKWYWYCYEKARIEDMLFQSRKRNWTIVRPGITMNANHIGWGNWWNDNWIGRVMRGRSVVVERDMLDFRFSLSSGEQVASLIGAVIGNPKAMGEVFNVCSQETWSWRELLDIWEKIFLKYGYKMRVRYINSEDVIGTNSSREYWYKRGRLLDRVFDNSKIRAIVSPHTPEKCVAKLLDEWAGVYLKNNKKMHISSASLRQTVEIDKFAGDFSFLCDFGSVRLYSKYLIMRYCPIILKLYSCLRGLPSRSVRMV